MQKFNNRSSALLRISVLGAAVLLSNAKTGFAQEAQFVCDNAQISTNKPLSPLDKVTIYGDTPGWVQQRYVVYRCSNGDAPFMAMQGPTEKEKNAENPNNILIFTYKPETNGKYQDEKGNRVDIVTLEWGNFAKANPGLAEILVNNITNFIAPPNSLLRAKPKY